MKHTKFREPSVKDLKRTDDMITVGLNVKDHLGQPYFLPIEGGGYCQNFNCQLTKAQFEAELRKYGW